MIFLIKDPLPLPEGPAITRGFISFIILAF